MKTKVKRLALSVLLCLALIVGMIPGFASVVKAEPEERTWPYLEADGISIEGSKVEWKEGVSEGFESQVVGYEIVDEDPTLIAKQGWSNDTGTINTYDIGNIIIYVDKLPVGAEILSNETLKRFLENASRRQREKNQGTVFPDADQSSVLKKRRK